MPGVALGFRRLRSSTMTRAQPMSNEDGSVWVVFNGEIYNFVDLRRRLEGSGQSFAPTATPRRSSIFMRMKGPIASRISMACLR